jgi:transcriptional regulator with XRE-family HTH domain
MECIDSVGLPPITASQLRAARAMIRMDQCDLAERAGISGSTLKRYENCYGPLFGDPQKIKALINALEREGVVFLPDDGSGAGLRLVARARRR